MESKIMILYELLISVWPQAVVKVGRPQLYTWPTVLLFLMVMFLKRIHSMQAMERYAAQHYRCFGWSSAPSRRTLTRRFQTLPSLVYRLMPLVAQVAQQQDRTCFGFRWAFIDKSVFRAKGGVWHRAQRLLGIVPHRSIDTQATWAKSAYHGWRYGYGLHLVCNVNRFPLACSVTTAAQKDTTQLMPLLVHFVDWVGVVVADAGYIALKLVQQISQIWNIFILLPKTCKGKSTWVTQYNQLIQTPQAHWLYRQRKPSVEPAFALIKQLFELSGENQLPYQSLAKVKPYLMMTAFSIQLMMYYNWIHKTDLATTQLFLADFK